MCFVCQASGEAEYVSDRPPEPGQLALALVRSTICKGRVTSIDFSQAKVMEVFISCGVWKACLSHSFLCHYQSFQMVCVMWCSHDGKTSLKGSAKYFVHQDVLSFLE